MSLATVLETYFKKGAVVFPSSDQLKEVKTRLYQYLDTAVPWKDQTKNSGFGVFAEVKWQDASNQKNNPVCRSNDGQIPVGEKLWAKYDQGGGGDDLPNVIRDFSKLMLEESKIAKFIEESEETKYELGIDYYPNRAPKSSGEYHKDAYKNTTFIMLAYLNQSPVWGAEWILDPGDRANLDGGRAFESVLPQEIQKAIRTYRQGVAAGDIGSDKEKDHQKWRQFSRCKIIEPMGNIAFFDPVVTHSSPYPEDQDVSDKFFKKYGKMVIKQDQIGYETHTAVFRFEDPGTAERKITNEIKRWQEYSEAAPRLAHLDLAVTEAVLEKLQRGEKWLEAKETTFSAARAFIRIEVRAYKKA
jgi:hypothetical protein